MGEGDAIGNQRIERRRLHVRIAERTDCVEPLLIGAIPEDVRPGIGHERQNCSNQAEI